MSGLLGLDKSGNNNHWTPTNLAATDVVLDTPTNNFATLNPLKYDNGAGFQEGNLKAYTASSQTYPHFWSTVAMPPSGKWYCEAVTLVSVTSGGISVWSDATNSSNNPTSRYSYLSAGTKYSTTGGTVSYGSSYTTGDIIGIAYDSSNGQVTFYKNNVSQGVAFTLDTSGTWYFGLQGYTTSSTQHVINFGQDSSFAGNKTAQNNTDDNGYGDFYYSPPTDYLALCTQNLDDPADGLYADGVNPNIDMVLWTGDGATSRVISANTIDAGVDFAWIKSRSHAQGHIVGDVVRGDNKALSTNTTWVEDTGTNIIQSIGDASSFTVGNAGRTNTSGYTYVAWLWKMGGTGVSNTDGSITSTVSANVAAGQSIVSYTGNGTAGATVGHGLSSAPELYIVKPRNLAGESWATYHKDLGASAYIGLNWTNAAITSSSIWNNTAPTSSVFSLYSYDAVNKNGTDYIAYCFHSVEGYSKVFDFDGNESSDGNFIYLGFLAKYVILKTYGQTGDWWVWDIVRDTLNPLDSGLKPASSAAESTPYTAAMDVVANGIKIREGASDINRATGIIGYAVADKPFKYSNAR